MMYQESIMKYLVWLGIEEKDTYDVIKKIAKKKFKEEELNALQKQLEQGWIKNVGTINGFAETWQVVQDAAHYSFNASHSLSVAIDSIYGAYLKSHYPLEYFTVVLTLYASDMDRTSKLIAELPYFNIKLLPIKFGKSGAGYTMDKVTNCIYKGITSVKFCNAQIADELMELSKNKYNTFIDLLKDIKEKTSVNSRQLNILTGLNFFSDWGKNEYLLNVIDIYDKFANKKVISKNKIEQLGITEFIIKKYAMKETKSQYRDIDNEGLIKELCSSLPNKALDIISQVKFEIEHLEYTTYTNPKIKESYYIVISFKTFKDATKPYVTLRNIKTGEEIKTKIVQSKIFRENPFGLFSILEIKNFVLKHKKKLIDDKWVEIEETEPIIEEYETIKQ